MQQLPVMGWRKERSTQRISYQEKGSLTYLVGHGT